MSAIPKRLEDEAMRLPARLRARLAERLIASLDQEPADTDTEGVRAAEAQRSAEELVRGEVEGTRRAAVTDVVFHPLAQQELVDTANVYESRAAGLGHDFIREMEAHARTDCRQPGRWKPIYR